MELHLYRAALVIALFCSPVLYSGTVAWRSNISILEKPFNQSAQIESDNNRGSLEPRVVDEELKPLSLSIKDALNSATGSLFHGEKTRSFTGSRAFQKGWTSHQNNSSKTLCKRWNVVTTIFAPSEGVKRAARVPGWCTVIIADTKTPIDYMKTAGFEGKEETIHFLSVPDQEQWAREKGIVGEFLAAIPYRHFARKNIGYLYAILHGAEFLFDFDDDNILNPGLESPLVNETHLEGTNVVLLGQNVFNHHQLMGASIDQSWPRGFPLDKIQNHQTYGKIAYGNVSQPMDSIAVMQFCADGNPDIDAVHRLVHPLPMTFTSPDQGFKLLVPSHAFVPYNAQATIHTRKAMWALFLPFTVPGRVSDIWRGYFAQALFRDLGMHIAMLPPDVVQDRNEHNYLGDMNAESDLYFKTGKLIEFLSSWQSPAQTVPERMEALWIDLYEREYIDENDVIVLQLWLQALIQSGYKFPKLLRQRIDNTVLMGQFNYASNVSEVIFWTQKWRTWFNRISIRGPFSELQVKELKDHGIDAHQSQNDKGHFSPMANLAATLVQYQNHSQVNGVVYVHDDALLNIKGLLQEYFEHATDVLATFDTADPRRASSDPSIMKRVNSLSYKLLPDGTFQKIDGTKAKNATELEILLETKWSFWKSCMDGFNKLYQDPRSNKYLEADGSLVIPSKGQSDFLYVPIQYATAFEGAATSMVDQRVFLECGMPKIADILRGKEGAPVKSVSLCTAWNADIRGTDEMIQRCGSRRGMYHPYKLGARGYRSWSDQFETITNNL